MPLGLGPNLSQLCGIQKILKMCSFLASQKCYCFTDSYLSTSNVLLGVLFLLKIWESCSNSLITFNQKDLVEQMAYVAENDVILESITRSLATLSDRVEVLYNTKVQHIDIPSLNSSQPNTWVRLKLQDGKSLKTKLLVSR